MNKRLRRFTSKFVIRLVVAMFVGVIIYLSYQNAIDRFKDFRITIDNQSTYELTGIQAGLIGLITLQTSRTNHSTFRV
ncbi:hypothetical protein AB9M62_08365 [Bacillales bacterium AN1005]